MSFFLQFFVLIPLLTFLLSLLLPKNNEKLISKWAIYCVGLHLITFYVFFFYWLWQDRPTLDYKEVVLFKAKHYEYFVDFYFDKITATYFLVGSFLTFLVILYSRYYLHRESGYKRFFNTLLFCYLGFNMVIFSGNLETLFIGWEILGISSFLLIAFYRNRYLPVKNAVKVFSVYRIGDVGLILAIWLMHHLFQENITFFKLNDAALVHAHLGAHGWIGLFISLLILVSAAAKSAQLPFSSWLSRAMEGPTPSSAIFYGSLSVHMGVFLLLRTAPFWEQQLYVRIIIGLLGLSTSVVATGIARVQSSIKSQIAYASIAQIGLIFIELAAGFTHLALLHFAGNSFLRTYQLLISPSVVSYLIREQFYHFVPRHHTVEDSFPSKLKYSLYMLCLKEYNLDNFLFRFLWNPLKIVGQKLNFLTNSWSLIVMTLVFLTGLSALFYQHLIPISVKIYLPYLFSFMGVAIILKSFTERKHALVSWFFVIMHHFWITLAISFNEHFNIEQVYFYLSGIVVAGLLGFIGLYRLKAHEGSIALDQFHGHSYRHPKIALLFLLACLGVSGFPLTPAFIGEDLIFMHIQENQPLLAFMASLAFIIDGLAIVRMYARIFFGPHVKSIYEMAYRSS